MADLIYEVHNHLARITLNRPKQLNCFSEEMIRLWTEALEDVRDNDDVYALLLSGNGKAFCAGGDVKAMAAGDGFFESHEDISSTALARKNSLWKGIQRIPLLLEEIDKPVVAKIHGAAVGAGLDMALMCDVRIAGENASMSESYFNAGIVPGDGGAYFLPRLVGREKRPQIWDSLPIASRMQNLTHLWSSIWKSFWQRRSRLCASQNAQSYRVSRVLCAPP